MKKVVSVLSSIVFVCIIIYIVFPTDKKVAIFNSKLKENNTTSEMSSKNNMYWYNDLTQNEKKAYRNIYSTILDFPEKIAITKVNEKEIKNIFQALSYDNPEFFFLGNSSTIVRSGYIYFFIPEYTMTKKVYDNYMSQLNNIFQQIESATANMTDYEKELYVHDYIINTCEYNDTGSNIRCTAYGALINKQANCEGYSRATQFLLNNLGVKTRVIIGEAFDGVGGVQGHMWNVVTIDGKEYNLDVTWDDPKTNSIPKNSLPTSHMYMNIPTDEILITHKASNEKYYSVCVYDDANYYKINNLFFDDYNNYTKDKIVDSIVKNIKNSGNNIEIKFGNESAYNTAINRLFKGEEIYRLILRANLRLSQKLNHTEVNYSCVDDKYIIRIFFKF